MVSRLIIMHNKMKSRSKSLQDGNNMKELLFLVKLFIYIYRTAVNSFSNVEYPMHQIFKSFRLFSLSYQKQERWPFAAS